MAGGDIVRFSLRLNLKNEQHSKIYKVLSALDKDVHKSENQFIIKAIEFYIQSFEDEDFMDKQKQKKRAKYVTVDELADIRREMESGLKDELIRLLGSAIIGSPTVRGQESRMEPIQRKQTEESNPFAEEAANRWG